MKKTNYIYFVMGNNDEHKQVYAKQLIKMHGHMGWYKATDFEAAIKHIKMHRNVICILPDDVRDLRIKDRSAIPANYSIRGIYTGDVVCEVEGFDNFYKWPVSARLKVKSVWNR